MKEDSLGRLKAVVEDEIGIRLTDAQAQEILDDRHVGSEIREWGVYDTETRSAIANFLAQRIVGRSWPTYKEPKTKRIAFWSALRQKGQKMGYDVLPEPEP